MYMLVFFFVCFFVYFSKKLILLLSLEGLMICLIFSAYNTIKISSSFTLMVTLSVILVVDSVFSMSVLVSSSRNSSGSSFYYSSM